MTTREDILTAVAGLGIQTNAPTRTGEANKGQELVPDEVFANKIFNSVPEYSRLLPFLPSDHSAGGSNPLDKVVKVPVMGAPGFFNGGAEKTSGAFAVLEGTEATTDEITITQATFVKRYDVTRELSSFSRYPEKLEEALRVKLAKEAARTIDSVILNGDSEAGATGNVNLDDSTPASTSYYLKIDNGIRERAINGSLTTSVGTPAIASLIAVMNKIGDYASDPDECLWIFNRETYNQYLGLQAFYDSSQRGQVSSVAGGKAINNILGSDLVIHQDFKKTEADGKISNTAGNNTKGGFGYIWKPAIQYGFGRNTSSENNIGLKLYDFGAQGFQLESWFNFGFTIAWELSGHDASLKYPVSLGINATV